MNNLETTKMQTPIEIALGVDEDGMTTGKKAVCVLGIGAGTVFKMGEIKHC